MAKLTTNKLALPLLVRTSEQPSKDRSPFALNRKLGTLDISPIIAPPIITPPPIIPQPNPFGRLVMGGLTAKTQAVTSIGTHYTDTKSTKSVAKSQIVKPKNTLGIQKDIVIYNKKFTSIDNHQSIKNVTAKPLWQDTRLSVRKVDDLGNLGDFVFDLAYHLTNTADILNEQVIAYHHRQSVNVRATDKMWACIGYRLLSKPLTTNFDVVVKKAVPVPCRYYPIPKLPPLPSVAVCQIRPPSDRLPLALRRKSHKRQQLLTDALPFALTCWHNLPTTQTPNKGAYIVHNTITATIGGLNIDLLNFSIKTDMDSFCWQGQIEITKKDYHKIKHKLDIKRGLEPLITVNINSHLFTIIAEDISKTRSFVNHTYTLSGRSVTAHLSQDYANVVELDNDLYASQIVNEVLANLPITAEFGVIDWQTHITATGTPIGIIDSVAKACGGFVMSDKADEKLYIHPRYKVPAWELATTTPDRIITLDVVKSISEQKRTNPRFNAVILTSSKEAAIVYREREGQDAHAPVSQNELYTDKACIIPAGIAILSDSGTHQTANLTIRWADKYNLPLATMGEIWQVNDKVGDTDDTWRGIVQSVSIDVHIVDGVPVVWQVVGLDRYLDV